MVKRSVKNPIEYMLLQAKTEKEIAEGIVETIRKKDSKEDKKYYEEKLALKMLDFFREEERLITLYAEAKENYPLLAELMENKRPYLKEMFAEAKRLFEKSIIGK